MAGFSDQSTGLADIRVIPPPAVMVVVDIGGGLLIADASGWQQRGSVVAGLAPVGATGHGLQDFECLQVRLSPVVAHAMLGACAELSGTVMALDDLWGREATRIQDAYLSGLKDEAAALVPAELLEKTALIGPDGYVADRLAAFRESGVTTLNVTPLAATHAARVADIEHVREFAA